MNKGDKFVIEIVFNEVMPDGKYNFGFTEIDPTIKDYGAMVEYAAAAYAAKHAPQPTPVAQDWQPQVGDRVLVEAEFSYQYTDGDCLLNAKMASKKTWGIICARSAIVGPAPVRARFAVGDEVYYKPGLEIVTIAGVAEHDSWVIKPREFARVSFVAADADLLTLAEARERLAK